jgi:hypothetical protein
MDQGAAERMFYERVAIFAIFFRRKKQKIDDRTLTDPRTLHSSGAGLNSTTNRQPVCRAPWVVYSVDPETHRIRRQFDRFGYLFSVSER